MQYRSDTKKVKGLGSIKHGFGHWWAQRLTAVLMVPLGFGLFIPWFPWKIYIPTH